MYADVYENILQHTELKIRQKDWKKCVKTLSLTEAQKKLKAFGVVAIIGRPGDGKTTLGLNLLRKSTGKKVILTNPHDWYILPAQDEKMTVLVDNTFGYDQIDHGMKEQWLLVFDMIWPQIIYGRVKLILLFRADIYYVCKEQLSRFEIFDNLHIISLTDRKYQLSHDQKIEIAKAHMQKKKSNIDHNELQDVVSNLTCLPFPRVCQIYENCEMAQKRGIEYFRNPVECLTKEVRVLKEQHVIQYFLLVLVMFLKGQLSRSFFYLSEEALPIIKQMQKFVPFRLDYGGINFESVANGMVGTYLSYSADGIYRFLHPVIHDSVLLSFSDFHLKDIIDICPVRFLVQYTRIPSCRHKEGALVVQVLLRDCEVLAKRIAVELIEGDFEIVLSHPALEDKGFVNILTNQVLKQKGCQQISGRKIGFFQVYKSGPFSMSRKYNSSVFLAPEFISSSMFYDSVMWICNYKTLLCLIVLKDLYYLSEMILSLTNATFFDRRLLCCSCFMGHLGAVQKLLPNLLCSVKRYSCFEAYRDVFLPCIVSKRENKKLLVILLKWWEDNLGYDTCYWHTMKRKSWKFCWSINCQILEDSSRMALAFMKIKYLESFLSFLSRKDSCVNSLNDLLHQLLIQFHCYLHKLDPKVETKDGIRKGLITDVIRLLQRKGATGYPGKLIFMAAQHPTSEALQVLLETSSSINFALGAESTVTQRKYSRGIFQNLIDQLDAFYSVGGRTPLLEASFRSLDSVKLLLEHGADVDAVDERGYTILHSRLVYSDISILQEILSRKITTIRPDVSNKTPLHLACEHGSFKCFLLMLSKYGNVNYVDGGSTALHIALLSAIDKCEKVDALLKAGADVNAADENGNTPLHLAAVGNRVNIVSKLIELGAEVNKKNKNGNTALHIALSTPSTKESLDILLDNGADVLIQNKYGVTPVYEAVVLTSANNLQKVLTHCPQNSPEFSQLELNPMRASQDIEKIKLLLNHGFCKTSEDAENCLMALADADFEETIDIDWVNDKEIQTNYDSYKIEETNTTCQDGLFEDIVGVICEKGVNGNRRSSDDFTPLHVAVNSSNIKMVELLLKNGVNPNAALLPRRDDFDQLILPESFHVWQLLINYGWKPDNSVLPIVATRKLWKTLKLLLERGYNVNSRSEIWGITFHNSIHSWRCLRLMIEQNADVNIQDRKGRTALHLLAADHRGKDKIALILHNKGNPNICDKDGNTPLLLACGERRALKEGKAKQNKEKVTKRLVHGNTITEFETKKKVKVPRDTFDCINENIKVLLENSADSNIRNKEGNAALHIAVNQCNCDLLLVLLSGGCSSNVTDTHGNTPLNLLLRGKIKEQIREHTEKEGSESVEFDVKTDTDAKQEFRSVIPNIGKVISESIESANRNIDRVEEEEGEDTNLAIPNDSAMTQDSLRTSGHDTTDRRKLNYKESASRSLPDSGEFQYLNTNNATVRSATTKLTSDAYTRYTGEDFDHGIKEGSDPKTDKMEQNDDAVHSHLSHGAEIDVKTYTDAKQRVRSTVPNIGKAISKNIENANKDIDVQKKEEDPNLAIPNDSAMTSQTTTGHETTFNRKVNQRERASLSVPESFQFRYFKTSNLTEDELTYAYDTDVDTGTTEKILIPNQRQPIHVGQKKTDAGEDEEWLSSSEETTEYGTVKTTENPKYSDHSMSKDALGTGDMSTDVDTGSGEGGGIRNMLTMTMNSGTNLDNHCSGTAVNSTTMDTEEETSLMPKTLKEILQHMDINSDDVANGMCETESKDDKGSVMPNSNTEEADIISSLTKPVTVGKSELWKMVNELLKHDADPNIKNQYGDAPLHYAAVMDCLRTVELMLKADADPDVEDTNSRTPLHRVAQCGHMRTARVLLNSGCDVDRTDSTGDTALHIAVRNMKYYLVKLFVEKGADLTKKNNDGENAFELCLSLEHSSKPCWWIHKGQKLLKMLDPEQNGPLPGSRFT